MRLRAARLNLQAKQSQFVGKARMEALFAELVSKFVQMIRQSNMSDAEKQQIIADLRAFKISPPKQRLNKL